MVGFLLAISNLSGGVIFLALALVFRYYKDAANLISGYNTSSEEEKARWNAKEMCRYMSNLLLFWTALMLVSGIIIFLIGAPGTAVWALLGVSWGVFAVTIVYTLVYLNRSGRFKA